MVFGYMPAPLTEPKYQPIYLSISQGVTTGPQLYSCLFDTDRYPSLKNDRKSHQKIKKKRQVLSRLDISAFTWINFVPPSSVTQPCLIHLTTPSSLIFFSPMCTTCEWLKLLVILVSTIVYLLLCSIYNSLMLVRLDTTRLLHYTTRVSVLPQTETVAQS